MHASKRSILMIAEAFASPRLSETLAKGAILSVLLLCFAALVLRFPPRTIIDAVLLGGALLGLGSTLCIRSLPARAGILGSILLAGLGAALVSYSGVPGTANAPLHGFQITISSKKGGIAFLTALSVDGKFIDLKTLVSDGVFEPVLRGGLLSTDDKLVVRYDKPYYRANLDYDAVGGGADLVIADQSATRLLRTAAELHRTNERYSFSRWDIHPYIGIVLVSVILVGGCLFLMAPEAGRIQTPALITGVLCAIVGLWLGSYPGLFSPDSVDQFVQCSTGTYRDWHPIPHSLVACALRVFDDTPFSLIVFQSTLYTLVGFAALFGIERKYTPPIESLARRNLIRVIFVIIAFNPATLAILMVFWKDILFGISMLLSIALVGRMLEVKSCTTQTTLLFIALAGVVLFRANGFLYLVVLIPLASIFDFKGRWPVLISSGAAILVYIGYKYIIKLFGIVDGQGSWVMHALALPLQTLAYAGMNDLITDPNQLSFIRRLFDLEDLKHTFIPYLFASMVYTSVHFDVFRENYGQVLLIWLSFVAAHPGLALMIAVKMGWMILIPFQIDHFRVFFIPTQSDSQYLWNGDAPFHSISIAPTFWEMATALDQAISHPIAYVLLSAATSIWMSTIFLAVFAWKSITSGNRWISSEDLAPIVAVASGICFMLGNTLIYPGPDLRYTWFLYGLAAFAFGLAFTKRKES